MGYDFARPCIQQPQQMYGYTAARETRLTTASDRDRDQHQHQHAGYTYLRMTFGAVEDAIASLGRQPAYRGEEASQDQFEPAQVSCRLERRARRAGRRRIWLVGELVGRLGIGSFKNWERPAI